MTREEEHRERCKEQGHVWENCCSATYQIYMKCKWCEEIQP